MSSSRVNFFLQNKKLTLETWLNLIKTSVSIILALVLEKTFAIYFLKRPICVLWQFVKTQVPIQLLVIKKLMATAVNILKLNRNSVDETNGSKENRMKWMHKRPKRETVVEVLQLRRTTFLLHYTYTHQINTQQWIKLHFTFDSCQAIFVDLSYLLQHYSIYLGTNYTLCSSYIVHM